MSTRLAVWMTLLMICGSLGACHDTDTQPSPTDPAVDSPPTGDDTQPVRDRAPLTANAELLERSSWQNPFRNAFWQADGWEFTESMMSAGESPATATLLRPWSRLMIELRWDTSIDDADESSSNTDLLTLGMRLPDSTAHFRVVIFRDRFELQRLAEDQQWLTLRSAEVDAVNSGRVRVNLTGNRILIASNDRLVINADRPSVIHSAVFVSLSTSGQPVQVSQMRIEGEGTSS